MKKTLLGIVITATLLLSSCASVPQAPILMDKSFFTNTENRVGIYFETKKATTNIYGASCLLCYGVASAANSALSSHFEAISLKDIESIKSIVINRLKEKGKTPQLVTLPKALKKLPKFKSGPGFPKKNFRSLKKKFNIDTLVVVHIPEHGAYRTYNGYFATSDPMGAILGTVYTIDLNTNAYIQYNSIDTKVSVTGNWDEPPTFPGVTSAYFSALEMVKEKVNSYF